MLHLTNLCGFGSGGKAPVSGGFVSAGKGTNVSSISSLSFGTIASNRYLVAVISGSLNAAITGVTIGGVTATIAILDQDVGGSDVETCIAIAAVPTGASGTVAWSGTNGVGPVCVSLYAIYGLGSATPTATASSNANPSTQSLSNLPAGSFVISGSVCLGTVNSWSGVTQDNSQTQPGIQQAVASKANAVGTQSISSSMTVSAGGPASASAAWSP